MFKIDSVYGAGPRALLAGAFFVAWSFGAQAQNAVLPGEVGISVVAAADMARVSLSDHLDVQLATTDHWVSRARAVRADEGDIVMMVMY